MHRLYNKPCKICGSKNNYLIENEGSKSLFCENCNNFEDIYVSEELQQYWDNEAKAEEQAKLQQIQNTPKCPICGSTNIRKIGTVNRMISVGVFGLASSKIGKTHKCNNCGTTW